MTPEQIRQEAEKLAEMTREHVPIPMVSFDEAGRMKSAPSREMVRSPTLSVEQAEQFLTSFAARVRNETIEFVAEHYDNLQKSDVAFAAELKGGQQRAGYYLNRADKFAGIANYIRSLKSQDPQ